VLGQGGVLQQVGTPAELLARPANAFVRSFLSSEPRLALLSLVPVTALPVHPLADADLTALPEVTVDMTALGLLDVAVTHPAQAAVLVDATGARRGVVRVADLVGVTAA
jgi:ABC-type proline/glycine betaine transport system ATPase subunit